MLTCEKRKEIEYLVLMRIRIQVHLQHLRLRPGSSHCWLDYLKCIHSAMELTTFESCVSVTCFQPLHIFVQGRIQDLRRRGRQPLRWGR